MSDRPRLYLESAGGSSRRRVDMGTEEITLGRLPENGVEIPHPEISGRHARISYHAELDEYLLEDLESRNGTLLAGVRVRQPEPLGRLDTIELGGVVEIIFHRPSADPGATKSTAPLTGVPAAAPARPTAQPDLDSQPADSQRLGSKAPRVRTQADQALGGWQLPSLAAEVPPVAASIQSQDAASTQHGAPVAWSLPARPAPPSLDWMLEIEYENRPFETKRLAPGEHLVGRESSCDVLIDHLTLSRRHARITISAGGAQITDLGSTNKTWVGEGVAAGPTTLEHQAQLRFGGVNARLWRVSEEA